MSCSREEMYQALPLFHTTSNEKLGEGLGMRLIQALAVPIVQVHASPPLESAHLTHMYEQTSLVPRPPCPAFVTCITQSGFGEGAGRISHVIHAAADVTDSVTFNLLLLVPEMLPVQRSDKLQMSGPPYTAYLDLKQNRLENGCNTMGVTWKRLFTLCSEPSLWKVQHLQLNF